MAEQNYEESMYDRAASSIRVHGILSVIFGSLGVFFGILFMLIIGLGGLAAGAHMNDVVGAFALGLFTFILWVLPHIYLIISGVQLMRQPEPKVAKVLIIINLIVGALWNLVILIFAIINLTQISDYEKFHKKFAHK